MTEAKLGDRGATDGARHPEPGEDRDLDPGAYIGNQPEREAETIPGGVGPTDERVAAYGSRPGVPAEPSAPEAPSPEQG